MTPSLHSLYAQLGAGGLAKAKGAIAKLDPNEAIALLDAARLALGNKPARPALRDLVELALEVATPAAVDMALECSHVVTLRTKPTARARRALFARVHERLSSMEPSEANRVLSFLVMRTTEHANADEVTLALLCAVIDDVRIVNYLRAIAAKHLAYHAFPGGGIAPRAAFVDAVAARAHLAFMKRGYVLGALLIGEPAQVYEDLAPRYRLPEERRDTAIDEDGGEYPVPRLPTWRESIAAHLGASSDPRWLDEALAIAELDAETAAVTLGKLGSPRAREELLQWADASALDDRVLHALRALGIAGDVRATPLVLRFLDRSEADPHVAALVDVLIKTARVDDIGAIQALISRRPQHAAELQRVLASVAGASA